MLLGLLCWVFALPQPNYQALAGSWGWLRWRFFAYLLNPGGGPSSLRRALALVLLLALSVLLFAITPGLLSLLIANNKVDALALPPDR